MKIEERLTDKQKQQLEKFRSTKKKKRKVLQKGKTKKKSEKLTQKDWEEIMGTNKRCLRRKKGGAWTN